VSLSQQVISRTQPIQIPALLEICYLLIDKTPGTPTTLSEPPIQIPALLGICDLAIDKTPGTPTTLKTASANRLSLALS
jgi:hypothetical protein